MQFALALDGNTSPHLMRKSGDGGGSERLMERLNIGVINQEKALRNRCFSGGSARTTQCVLNSDACSETLVSI
jgi:glucose-1-phosphate adenylyltransferase